MARVDEPSPSTGGVPAPDPAAAAATGPGFPPSEEENLSPAAVAAAERVALAATPELMSDSLGAYARSWFARVRGGESGILPVVGGLLLISILFQSLNHHFLTAENLVNLLIQAAVFMLLAMSEVFALLLGEIDLSIGFVSGIGGIITAELVKQNYHWSWWAAIAAALIACAAIGFLQGTIITRVGLPSFVVTLAGLLGWQGVMLLILGKGGALPINDKVINDLASAQLTATVSWIVVLALVAAFGIMTWVRDARRRASGLVAPPASLTVV